MGFYLWEIFKKKIDIGPKFHSVISLCQNVDGGVPVLLEVDVANKQSFVEKNSFCDVAPIHSCCVFLKVLVSFQSRSL